MSRAQAEERHRQWMKEYYASLVGYRCVEVSMEQVANEVSDWNEDWPTLTFENDAGERLVVEVSRDEEGNGPGFLFGLLLPERAS